MLLDKIDTFKKQKLLDSNSIKRIEIELYIENLAHSMSVKYKKEMHSTNTVYYFWIDESQIQMKILFRYGTYYTRHHVIVR